MPNPEALYTTVIQVSGTIVAIVGGFLTVYGLTQSTELGRMREHYRRATENLRRMRETNDRVEREFDWIDQERADVHRTLLASRLTRDELRDVDNRLDNWATRSRQTIDAELLNQRLVGSAVDEFAVLAGEGRHELRVQSAAGSLGIFALIPLTVFGIVIPILFLGRDDATPPRWHRTLTLVGFFFGLVVALFYIAWVATVLPRMREHQIRSLLDQTKSEFPMPEIDGMPADDATSRPTEHGPSSASTRAVSVPSPDDPSPDSG